MSQTLNSPQGRQILGLYFFGVEDWQEHYDVSFNKSQLAKVSQCPWDETVLTAPCPFYPWEKVMDTHFAFLGLEQRQQQPLTINRWHELQPASGRLRFRSYPPDSWYEEERFANEVTCQLRWYLILKGPVPLSEDKAFAVQQARLPREYEVPTAIEVVTAQIACFKKTGRYLSGRRAVRVKDTSSTGRRVLVGVGEGNLRHPCLDFNRGRDSGFWDGAEIYAARKLGT